MTTALPKHNIGQRRKYQGSAQTVCAEFPRSFTLAGSCVDAQHQEEDVEGRKDVEDFEVEVPVAAAQGVP
jgi:hypothetical protein